MSRPLHIALFMHGLTGGGVQRATLNLSRALTERGHKVDIVVGTIDEERRHRVPQGVRLLKLRRSFRWRFWPLVWRADPEGRRLALRPVLLPLVPQKALYYLADLTRYLREERPDAMVAADTYCNIAAIWARRQAGTPTRIIVSERNALGAQLLRPERRRAWRWRYAPPLIRHVYPQADAIVSVSDGVRDDLAAVAGLPVDSIVTIYNASFLGETTRRLIAEPVTHPWLVDKSAPVLVGVGRLVLPKDFATLIRAFARVRAVRPARLIILGDEKTRGERARLQALATELGVAADVDLHGFVENPFAFLARADVFVLSSRREGIANVVIEALVCGCPVVSTDCQFGPYEVLEGGRYGRLVPVGDDQAMAAAIVETLDNPPDREVLRERGATFSLERVAQRYLELIDPDEAKQAAGA